MSAERLHIEADHYSGFDAIPPSAGNVEVPVLLRIILFAADH